MSQTINVDITPNNFQPTLNYSQGDVGRTFSIKIVSQYGDTLPAGATVKIQATKPSGFGFDVTADSVTDNVATFTTTAEMTDEWGRFPAQLDVTKDAVTIFSAKFLMVGAKNTHPEGTTDGSQGTIIPELTLLVERVEAAASSVLDMEVEAQTLPAGSLATYSYDEDENKATFGIPQGEAGAGAAGVTASAYSASKTYAVGEYVIHNNNLYRCTTAITTAESFTAAHWTQVVLGDDVTDLKSDISDISTVIEQAVDITTIANTYIAVNGTTQTGAYHAEIPVIKGEKYKIKSSDGSSVRAYVMMSGGSVVEYYGIADPWKTLHDYDIEYTIPQDGTLCINSIDNLYIGAKKVDLVPLNKINIDGNTKARTDALQLNKSKNLFNGEYVAGGYRAGRYISENEQFCYSKPIYLEAGTYLYTASTNTFGSNGSIVFVVDQSGGIYGTEYNIQTTSIGTASEYRKYNNRRIDSFTLNKGCFVSFNLGRLTSGNIYDDMVSNFMLVEGSTLADFPHYEPYYAPFYSVKDEDINGLSGLRGKIAIFDGDSICHGTSVGASDPTYSYGYAGRVGEANDMIWKNYGVSGGAITSASNPTIGSSRHSVADNIDTLYAQFPDADFIIFEGGTNDADLLGNAIADPTKLGTFSENDYSGTYDATTFSGALETILYKSIQYWKGKKIGFIVAQKMGYGYSYFDKDHANRRAYFERAIEICNKWGVPCLNLWDGCYLNPNSASCYDHTKTSDENISGGYLYIDGQHLTAKGYDYISPIIENWMKSL